MATIDTPQLAITSLYVALFNRAPDAAGLTFWLEAYRNGASLSDLTATFLGTAEGQSTHPATISSQELISQFYMSVFGRRADPEGLQFWVARLEALGGPDSTSAKAQTIASITQVASTQLTGKPEGMSDETYAQTLADRAVFLNKTNAGLYFADQLGSNNLSLAKQILAGVTADPASVALARALADQGGYIAPVVPPSLDREDDAAAISAALAGYFGTLATADTTGMNTDQLKALAEGAGKFSEGALTGTLAMDSTITSDQAVALLSKHAGTGGTIDASLLNHTELELISAYIGKLESIAGPHLNLAHAWPKPALLSELLSKSSNAQVDVTDSSGEQLSALFGQLVRLADNGITGTLEVSGSVPAPQLATLLQKVAPAANISVDATSMDIDQIVLLFTHSAKIDAVSGLSVPPGTLARLPSDPGDLLGKGSDIRIDLTGANAAQLKVVSSFLPHFATDGLGGTYSLDQSFTDDQLGVLLGDRVSVAANVTVNAAQMTDAQLIAIAQRVEKADGISGIALTPANLQSLTAAQLSNLLSKASSARLDLTGLPEPKLAAVLQALGQVATEGLSGNVAISSAVPAATLQTLFPKIAAAANVAVNAASMDPDQILALFVHAAKIDAVSNLSVPSETVLRLPNDFGELFTKGNGFRVDLTGATAKQLKIFAQFPLQYAQDGLTGTYSLDQSLSELQLRFFLGTKASMAATVTVDAANMTDLQLLGVAQLIDKVDTIQSLSLTTAALASLSATDIASLLAKSAGAQVEVTGLSGVKLASVLGALDHIAAEGLSGVLQLDSAQLSAVGVSALNTKLSGSPASVRVQGDDTDELLDLTSLTRSVFIDAGAGADTIQLGSGPSTVFIAGKNQPEPGNPSSTGIDHIVGFKPGDRIMFSTEPNAFAPGLVLGKNDVPSVETFLSLGTFADLNTALSEVQLGISTTGQPALTQLSFEDEATGFERQFLIVNDNQPGFSQGDTVIELQGSLAGNWWLFDSGI